MDLDLIDPVHSAAVDFFTAFPWCTFTSGRRSLEAQARAMASNVQLNRQWIAQTYVPSPASQACQSWVDANPEVEDTQSGLLFTLRTFTNEALAHLSKHLAGRAFDVEPVAEVWPHDWLAARALRIGGKFLDKEGGLVRWHFEA